MAVVGFAMFVVVLFVAGSRYPGYSAVSDAIGDLGADDAPHPDLIGVGYLALAVGTVAAGIALLGALRGRAGRGGAIVVGLSGVAVSSLAFVRQDCSTAKAACVNAGLAGDLSMSHTIQRVLAVLVLTALVVALVMITLSLRGRPGFEAIAEAAMWASAATAGMFIWYGSELYGDVAGAIERVVVFLAFGWPVVLSVVLTRRLSALRAAQVDVD
jgi:Protein of unknown function (DUF998)